MCVSPAVCVFLCFGFESIGGGCFMSVCSLVLFVRANCVLVYVCVCMWLCLDYWCHVCVNVIGGCFIMVVA